MTWQLSSGLGLTEVTQIILARASSWVEWHRLHDNCRSLKIDNRVCWQWDGTFKVTLLLLGGFITFVEQSDIIAVCKTRRFWKEIKTPNRHYNSCIGSRALLVANLNHNHSCSERRAYVVAQTFPSKIVLLAPKKKWWCSEHSQTLLPTITLLRTVATIFILVLFSSGSVHLAMVDGKMLRSELKTVQE